MDFEIKQVRLNLGITQEQFAKFLEVPIKTLRNWEQGIRKPSKWTLNLIIDKALNYQREKLVKYDENHGILSFMQIKSRVAEVAHKYRIDKVIMFGSYANGQADETSDIDLFMESDIDGLDYFGVVEDFRETLGKSVDVLSSKTVKADSVIQEEIKNTGVIVYER